MLTASRALCALIFLLGAGLASAQPVKPVGAVRSVDVRGAQLLIRTDNAYVELTAYSPHIVRVRADQQALGRDFSYAVVARPQPVAVEVSQNEREIVMSTGAVRVHVARQPFAIRFSTPDNKTINEDEPGLTLSWIGSEVTSYKKMQDGEHFIGLGEKTGNLDKRGSAYTNWNTDAFRYTGNTDPLYASVPFYIGIHHGLSYGIFFDNSYQSDFNFGASNNRFASFGARGGEMNYYFIHHREVADIIDSYTALTGRMPLPPLWSLGYQQNRYSYYPQTEVMRIAQTLREKQIPADGITLDIHYMDGYKLFTWDQARFPDPAGMTAKLAAMGLKTTVIVDPGIKIEPGYGSYQRGMADDVFIKYADGSNYSGEVWPGWCHFPDFTGERARAWWRKEVRSYAAAGVAGLWNDMNEISTWGQRMPNNVLFDFDGAPTTHLQARNVYALGMVRASYEGMKAATGQRPFMLTRAAYAGSQRYSALWTGDNTATDEHMLLGVRMLSSLGVSGMPFVGMDVGGFLGTPEPKLYARWMQIGAFTPYFRNHAASDSKSSEPWTYGEDVLDISRNYINLRYRLMPYLYSSFQQAAASGMPVMRTLAIDYTHDPKVYEPAFQNQYLFGPAFLVAPFDSNRDYGKVHFPAGRWYDLYTDQLQQGGQDLVIDTSADKLPVWVRQGSIVPMQSLVQSTAQRPDGTLSLHLYRGDGQTSLQYYEDDGASFAYQQGQYYRRNIAYDGAAGILHIGKVEGQYKSAFSKIELVLHGFGASPQVRRNDKPLAQVAGTATMVSAKLGHSTVTRVLMDNDAQAFSIAIDHAR